MKELERLLGRVERAVATASAEIGEPFMKTFVELGLEAHYSRASAASGGAQEALHLFCAARGDAIVTDDAAFAAMLAGAGPC